MASKKPLSLNDSPLIIVDLETTGVSAQHGEILEIGAVKLMNGEVVETFESLVKPKGIIPYHISQITGIRPLMVATAPPIEEVFPRFLDFIGEEVLIAHNAPFDLGFLRATHEALLGTPLENPHLCTLKLARKLLPKDQKKGLDALATLYGLTNIARHRALGDALVTAEVLKRFLAILTEEFQIDTLAGLVAFEQLKATQIKRGGLLPHHLLKEEAYPSTPGVYWMSNAQGEILYIGKAKNLRTRIRSYFQKPKSQPRKVIEMMQQMAHIDWMPLGSELEALITEAKLIKLHQPHFNRMVKHFQHFPFIKITAHEDYPQISVTPHLDDERAIYFGPFHHKSWVEETLENVGRLFRLRSCSPTVFKQHKFAPCLEYALNQCSGPCAGLIAPNVYKSDLEDLMAYLKGQGAQVIERLEDRRNALSEAMAYEKAQDVQVQIQNLLKLKKRSDLLSRAVHDTHCLILLPSVVPGALTLLLLLHGQIQRLDAVAYHQEAMAEWIFSLPAVLDTDMTPARKTFIPKDQFEETRLVMSWLQSRPQRPTAPLPSLPAQAMAEDVVFPEAFGEEGQVFPIALPLSPEGLWADIQEALVQPVQTRMFLNR